MTAFLGCARYERTPEARGLRNGNRPRQVQTAEGELEIRARRSGVQRQGS